ncbi:DUF222 domain-containing protein [Aeromicrobium sp. 179-A 4D2 NHS]|uniref:DUF222 domain-containing protein n=1 Tax=Aeromicrobium sp. 179-A 4D2 NHS TaxID=3142375 RepID=UPI0039A3F7FA
MRTRRPSRGSGPTRARSSAATGTSTPRSSVRPSSGRGAHYVGCHGPGTSWLNALLPTGVAIAVGDRLGRAAKALPSTDHETGEKDSRTREQKQADLLAHWLTSSEGTQTDIRAEVAIGITATDLIGLTDGPGLTLDGEPVGSAWVRELAQSEHTVFRRLVLDRLGRVLDTEVIGYRPTAALRQALRWRDGTCRVAGCRAPAHQSDQDHALTLSARWAERYRSA